MFSFGGWARNDLQDYRSHYPNNRDDPTLNDNVRFYRNQIPLRPENKTIEEIHEQWYGNWEFLEYCHSYIQWLFPIQESGLNWQAQILQKHEIETMKNDPQVLKRILKSFELMLDFYGFEIQTAPSQQQQQQTQQQQAAAVPPSGFKDSEDSALATSPTANQQQQQTSASSTLDLTTAFRPSCALNPLSNARIIRNTKGFQKQFHNLNTSGHNYLRITRMNKFLGEMGLEHLKLAWLAAFERELFQDKFLYNCVDSYSRYWIGTIYDDDLREAAEERAEKGKATAEQLKKEAWASRFGVASGEQLESKKEDDDQDMKKQEIHGDADAAEQGIRVITDFGSRENSAVDKVQVKERKNENDNDDDDGANGEVQKQGPQPEQQQQQQGGDTHVFRFNTSDMEDSRDPSFEVDEGKSNQKI